MKIQFSLSSGSISLPEVRYGSIEDPIKWRDSPDKTLDDDEELEDTPEDVVQLLGFDPRELLEMEDGDD